MDRTESGRQPNTKHLFIGPVEIPGTLYLAPLAGVSDHPFRVLCREKGAALTCLEMISANALKYGNKKTEELIRITEDEHPVSLQLFGPDPETIAAAAEKIAHYPFDILDLNMGCPMPKIVNNHEGSDLMRDPKRAASIVRAAVRATDRPVTVKFRRGFSEGENIAAEFAKYMEDAGASAVIVHGRTREQYYSGRADWECIREAKEAVKIPVIGNGDVRSIEEAERRMDESGCDAVMIGRAAYGNPWIFSGERPGMEEIRAMMLRHARMQLSEKGAHMGILQMRKHIAWYTSGFPNAAALRKAINAVSSYEELEELLNSAQ